ncbi:MAG: urease accessory protein UreF [Rhodocyclaceae bacterium]
MPLALVRLLQLASPALPVGAYTYSQGLEMAADAGIVRDEASACLWIGDLLDTTVGRFEAPLLARLMETWRAGDFDRVASLNDDYLASRETSELRAETEQMGYSLLRLLRDLGEVPGPALAPLQQIAPPAFPTVWSFAASAWELAAEDAVTAWMWSWLENQVMAAVKLVPLGQTAGQRLLLQLGARIPSLARTALETPESEFSNFSPAFAIACCRHETQYSRLFRS